MASEDGCERWSSASKIWGPQTDGGLGGRCAGSNAFTHVAACRSIAGRKYRLPNTLGSGAEPRSGITQRNHRPFLTHHTMCLEISQDSAVENMIMISCSSSGCRRTTPPQCNRPAGDALPVRRPGSDDNKALDTVRILTQFRSQTNVAHALVSR
jgi:hypothetical protein